ncbi:AMP-binding protein [Herbiconiux liangxiaofengii]|uniref:AMP-binding protein n=1 Tax=Herbiconiux liangxiaofengii TaxID=3342795 RepID=UPI0035BB33FB
MSRPLEVLSGLGARELTARLRVALANEGPALLPREGGRGGAGGAAAPAAGGGGVPLGDAGGERAVPVPAEVPKAVSVVIETSGSTGVPKRVALSSDALLASAAASEQALGGPGQWLLALPTHYVAGVQVLVRSIAAGTEPVVHPSGSFSPGVFADLTARLEHPLRFTSLVPAQLARLVEAAEADRGIRRLVARLDGMLVGGQALPEPLRERALDLGFAVIRTYGASETAGGCVYEGRPLGRTLVRVHEGELEISGPTLAEGYLGDEVLTAERFRTADGRRWYRTSDGGTVVDGVVSVTGRLDDLIISGGIKVSLGRVERVVQGLPGFEGAVVVPRASERWGQVGVVVLEGAPTAQGGVGAREGGAERVGASAAGSRARTGGGAAGAGGGAGAEAGAEGAVVVEVAGERVERVRAAVVAVAGRAAAPAAVVFVPELPRLSSGKPDRRLIEQRVGETPPQARVIANPSTAHVGHSGLEPTGE